MIKKIKTSFFSQFSFFMAMPAMVWQILLGLLPLLLIGMTSFIDVSTLRFVKEPFQALFTQAHIKMIFWSLILAICTTSCCLIIAYPVAFYIAQRIRHFKNLCLFLLIVPFWTNLLVLVYSWIFILERNGILNTFLLNIGIIKEPIGVLNSMLAVGLVALYCYLPFMIMPLYSSLEKIDPYLLEASADLGASSYKTFVKIIIPMSWPGIRTGCFLVFVPVFGEYVIPLLMGGDKYMFVGNGISHYVFTALNLSRGAAFTILSGIILVISLLLFLGLLKRLVHNV